MKHNWKRLSAVVAIAATLLLMVAMVGLAQHGGQEGGPRGRGFHGGPPRHGGPGGPGPHDVLGHLARAVNLTEEQKAEIKKLTDSFEESTKALREQMHALRPEGPGIPADGAFNEAAVRAAAQARANVQVEMEVAHARLMSQIFGVLTAEQKAQLEAKRQEFEQRRKEREAQRGNAPQQ